MPARFCDRLRLSFRWCFIYIKSFYKLQRLVSSMNLGLILAMGWLSAACLANAGNARIWTDSTGRYTLEAKLVTFNERSVVLKREDHELVAIPIEKLSGKDREF